MYIVAAWKSHGSVYHLCMQSLCLHPGFQGQTSSGRSNVSHHLHMEEASLRDICHNDSRFLRLCCPFWAAFMRITICRGLIALPDLHAL